MRGIKGNRKAIIRADGGLHHWPDHVTWKPMLDVRLDWFLLAFAADSVQCPRRELCVMARTQAQGKSRKDPSIL
jgi:hypothetical protein